MSQNQLIARKHEVRRKIEQTQRELAQVQTDQAVLPSKKSWFFWEQDRQGWRRQQKKITRLRNQLEALMAEEYRLRTAIDRSR